MLIKPAFDPAFLTVYMSLKHSDILALLHYLAPVVLEGMFSLLILGKHNES